MAATIAAQAGANVVLFEAGGWLGGRLGLQTQLLQGPRSIYKDATGVDFCQRIHCFAEHNLLLTVPGWQMEADARDREHPSPGKRADDGTGLTNDIKVKGVPKEQRRSRFQGVKGVPKKQRRKEGKVVPKKQSLFRFQGK